MSKRKVVQNKCDGWAVVMDDGTILDVCWYKKTAYKNLKVWRSWRIAPKSGRICQCTVILDTL